MKDTFKKSNLEFNLNNIGEILSSGAAVGIAIANFTGKKANVGGVIGASISLLIGGIIFSMNKNDK